MTDIDCHRKPMISVVMPLYCEGSHLRAVLADVCSQLAAANVSYEIILVDDGSPDNTWAILDEEAKKSTAIRAIQLSRNFGKELALCAGIELACGDAIIVMDGDGQHPPSLLPKMIQLWQETGVDIVEATKTTRGKESFLNKLTAGLFYIIWNKLSGFKLKGASDFKLLNRRAVNALLQMEERNVFFRGMTAWLGFRRIQISFTVAGRLSGRTAWSQIRLINLALTGITSFSTLPLHLVTLMGVLFLLFSVVLGLQTLYIKFYGKGVSGFTTVILLLLIIGSLLMISLGIIGEYLSRIYDEVKRRPRYIISQTIRINGENENQSSRS